MVRLGVSFERGRGQGAEVCAGLDAVLLLRMEAVVVRRNCGGDERREASLARHWNVVAWYIKGSYRFGFPQLVILLLDPSRARLRIQLGEEASRGLALEFGAVGRWRDHGLSGGRVSLRKSEVVVLPAVESDVHVDMKKISGLVESLARIRLRAMLVLRIRALGEAGGILAVGVEDWDVQVLNIAQVEVDEAVEVLIADGGHVVELLRLRPRRASRGVHRMGNRLLLEAGDVKSAGKPVGFRRRSRGRQD